MTSMDSSWEKLTIQLGLKGLNYYTWLGVKSFEVYPSLLRCPSTGIPLHIFIMFSSLHLSTWPIHTNLPLVIQFLMLSWPKCPSFLKKGSYVSRGHYTSILFWTSHVSLYSPGINFSLFCQPPQPYSRLPIYFFNEAFPPSPHIPPSMSIFKALMQKVPLVTHWEVNLHRHQDDDHTNICPPTCFSYLEFFPKFMNHYASSLL